MNKLKDILVKGWVFVKNLIFNSWKPLKTNTPNSFLKWNALQEDGKNAGKWDGNGSVKDWKRKRERGNWEEQEVNKHIFLM